MSNDIQKVKTLRRNRVTMTFFHPLTGFAARNFGTKSASPVSMIFLGLMGLSNHTYIENKDIEIETNSLYADIDDIAAQNNDTPENKAGENFTVADTKPETCGAKSEVNNNESKM